MPRQLIPISDYSGNSSLYHSGELLAPIAAEAMEEAAVGEEAGTSTVDSDDALQQSAVQLVETIDEPLAHDITGK